MTALNEPTARELGAQARAVMRACQTATLATALARDGDGHPYASLVLAALDHEVAPVLLLSDLADHARNLRDRPQAALLYRAPVAAGADPLALPRVSVLGTVREIESENVRARLQARYLMRHPSARTYAGFGDFRLYRMAVERAHLVAGFGRVHWLSASDVLFEGANLDAWAAAEQELLAQMNAEDPNALARAGAEADGLSGGEDGPGDKAPWRAVGVDPEGVDLRAGGRLARAPFPRPVAAPARVADAFATAWGHN